MQREQGERNRVRWPSLSCTCGKAALDDNAEAFARSRFGVCTSPLALPQYAFAAPASAESLFLCCDLQYLAMPRRCRGLRCVKAPFRAFWKSLHPQCAAKFIIYRPRQYRRRVPGCKRGLRKVRFWVDILRNVPARISNGNGQCRKLGEESISSLSEK